MHFPDLTLLEFCVDAELCRDQYPRARLNESIRVLVCVIAVQSIPEIAATHGAAPKLSDIFPELRRNSLPDAGADDLPDQPRYAIRY